MLNEMITGTLQLIPKSIVYRVARRYIAGETLSDAVREVKALNALGATATMDVLGEFVKTHAQAVAATNMALQMLDAIEEHKLTSGISVKLTSLGLDIDENFCYTNLRSIVKSASARERFVRIDMENSPYTSRTLELYKRLRKDGFENTGVVLQSRLRRSAADLMSLVEFKAKVRICKGIYIEPPAIAYQSSEEIRENYKKLLIFLFEHKMHVAIATHDDSLVAFAKDWISSIDKSTYEFQMLLGVREALRDSLLKEGYKVRVYVPFGKDWYGYSMRRLKENPEIAAYVFKAMFS
ncbi:MAG: proline dehydrogenase family protein [Bdellovibrio sp.]|nr:proline dehydrogenase family protein [Bdellovibrio sp.]